ALTDVDLGKIVEFHRKKEAAVTIGLKSVENPLEFGIVVTDDGGRIERFLEKPSWGQVFSDTINTGIYVLEPEVLRHVPTDRPFDFSKELFPLLLEMGRPLYGHVCDGYWQDIGTIDQFRQANFDALDERVQLDIPGIRPHVRIHEGAAIGDEVVLGAQSSIMPGVRIYPYKEIESGVQIHESVIWESRASPRPFGKDGVTGLVNVDLAPETVVRLAAAFGTALKRGARVVASREAPSACRMVKRAMISALNSTGVAVADLRVLPATVSRHLLKTHG